MEKHQKPFIPLSLILRLVWVFSGIGFAILSACAPMEVEKAFRGDLPVGKANKVIVNYCQICHIHKSFDPLLHVANVRSLYKRRVFRKSRECRSCHYLDKNWMYNQHKRKTRMPDDANRGKFKKFEKKEIDRLRKK